MTDLAILNSSMILHSAGIWRRVDRPLVWIVEAIFVFEEILYSFWTK